MVLHLGCDSCVDVCQAALPCTGCASTCSMFTTPSGTLSGGSGPSEDGSRCQWLIAPSGGATQITITFTEFSTEQSAGVLQVYQCLSISNMLCEGATMVRELSGSYSSSQAIAMPTGYALVQFTSGSSTIYSSFAWSWTSNVPWPLSKVSVYAYACAIHETSGYCAQPG
jgi:hypothetical protein